MNMENFIFDVDGDGIVFIIWDMLDCMMNVLFVFLMVEICEWIGIVIGDEKIKGVVFISGKVVFCVGVDFGEMEGNVSEVGSGG